MRGNQERWYGDGDGGGGNVDLIKENIKNNTTKKL